MCTPEEQDEDHVEGLKTSMISGLFNLGAPFESRIGAHCTTTLKLRLKPLDLVACFAFIDLHHHRHTVRSRAVGHAQGSPEPPAFK